MEAMMTTTATLPLKPEMPQRRPLPISRTTNEKNRLLAALPVEEYWRLAPHFEVVKLESRQVPASREQPMRHVFFPRNGVSAMLVPMEDGSAAEGATVGNEGMIGLPLFLGEPTASEEIVQAIPGEAVRLRASIFKEAVQRSPCFQTVLQRYTLALMNQMVRTAGCNRVHAVDQRCARRLVMSCGRVGSGGVPVAH